MQKNGGDGAILGFLYRVSILSRLLNERGYLHRAVITNGPVKCYKFEGSSIITGQGVVKATNLEKNLKVAGLFYDDTLVPFLNQRQEQIDAQEFIVPFSSISNWDAVRHAPNLSGVCFSQFEGWEHWKNVINSGDANNDKVINAKNLIECLKNKYSLP